MATDAKAILSHPRSDDLQLSVVVDGLKRWSPVLIPGLLAFTYAAVLLAELRLFDNDHDWINQAREIEWLAVVGEILRPVPERWGFQDRPVQILCFKLLYTLFGENPAAYYGFKALLLAGVAAGIGRLALLLGSDTKTAVLAGSIFALSSPGHASALWVSDFELLAEILILATLGVFWKLIQTQPTERTREWLHQALFVLLAVVAHRTKGSAKLIPAIVLIYLMLYRRDQIRRFLPAIAVIGLTIVPVLSVIGNPVPPFAPFAEDQSQGWMWKPANLDTLFILLTGNFHPIWGTAGPEIAYSLLAVVAPALLWPAVTAAAVLASTRARSLLTPAVGLVCIWLAVSLLSYASFPRLPEGFMARYVVVAMVPLSLLIAHLLMTAGARLPRTLTILGLACILTFHAAHNLKSTRHLRDTLGQVIVAYDLARDYIASRLDNANVLVIGFDYGYNREREDTNAYHREKLKIHTLEGVESLHVLVRTDQDLDAIEHRSTIQEIRESIRLPKVEGKVRVRVHPVRMFPGLTDSFYDTHIYRSRQSFAGILYEVTFAQEQS